MKGLVKKLNLTYLLIPLSLGLILLSFFSPPYSYLQLNIAMLFIIAYITVAILHHFLDKSLTVEAIFEYILIATLAVVILLGTVL